jgi:hypothetical protein
VKWKTMKMENNENGNMVARGRQGELMALSMFTQDGNLVVYRSEHFAAHKDDGVDLIVRDCRNPEITYSVSIKCSKMENVKDREDNCDCYKTKDRITFHELKTHPRDWQFQSNHIIMILLLFDPKDLREECSKLKLNTHNVWVQLPILFNGKELKQLLDLKYITITNQNQYRMGIKLNEDGRLYFGISKQRINSQIFVGNWDVFNDWKKDIACHYHNRTIINGNWVTAIKPKTNNSDPGLQREGGGAGFGQEALAVPGGLREGGVIGALPALQELQTVRFRHERPGAAAKAGAKGRGGHGSQFTRLTGQKLCLRDLVAQQHFGGGLRTVYPLAKKRQIFAGQGFPGRGDDRPLLQDEMLEAAGQGFRRVGGRINKVGVRQQRAQFAESRVATGQDGSQVRDVVAGHVDPGLAYCTRHQG